MGLYTSFGPGGIYEKLFSELPVDVPEVSLLTSPYVVRHADGTDVKSSQDDLYAIAGGTASLAERLAESIKLSGSNVRLNSPVLRLAYDESGRATGVDLLSGERVFAKQAIVSNLTVWDTYGKLVGLNRTPPEIKKQLNTLHSSGAYLLYASIEESALARLPSECMLVKDGAGEFTLAVSSSQTARGQACGDFPNRDGGGVVVYVSIKRGRLRGMGSGSAGSFLESNTCGAPGTRQ